MPLLLHEIKERLTELDEITLLELLNITSEDIDGITSKLFTAVSNSARSSLVKT